MALSIYDSKKDNNILKRRAVQNPETENPLIHLLANKINAALITNKNKPKVSIVAGKVKTTKIGFNIEKSNPITNATQIAVVYFPSATVTPGKK